MSLSAEQFEDRIKLAEKAQVLSRNMFPTSVGAATQGVAESRPPGADAFGVVEAAHISASSLASRIIELAEILCGQDVPPACVVGAKLPSGLLPALEERTNDLRAHLDAAHDAITRIRNHLPS